MYLAKIDIQGFKGIKHLVLNLNKDSSILIGENRWGRSSLISAFMLLSLDNLFYQFSESDFFYDEKQRADMANIRFIFSENSENELQLEHYLPLNAVSYQESNPTKPVICYKIHASRKTNKIITEHYFTDINDNKIEINNTKQLIELLIMLNPVMSLKNPINKDDLPINNQPLSNYYVEQLSTQLASHSQQFSPHDLEKGLVAVRALIEYYLVGKNERYHYKNIAKKTTPTNEEWSSLERINDLLDEINNDYIRVILMGVFSAIIIAKGNNQLLPHAVPILILEEPESQLHPIILSVGFRLLKNFPTQKFITTNSSDLVSLFSLEHIYHLIRGPSGIIAMHVEEDSISTADRRKILFHILYRRASAIFARCWLLVEGETEIWLLRELAEQSGFHLSSEGVQLIEFAQCGLKPLISYANKMGIQWYVLTDGDVAGKKYSSTAQSLIPKGCEVNDYLTVLPARDIENFLFKHGFSHVYKLAGYGSTAHIDLPVNRIIHKAIQKNSKPDLAIAICDDAKKRGNQAIPSLLKQTFFNVVKLAKTSNQNICSK
ncbi:DUF2813 domain-containing protein [Orbus sturtevantii]|uniref:DUF2813 domain-containing protein n=1 Tax=Orbus sturtevantii TaxID=3074109 RepID=UPI00370D012A